MAYVINRYNTAQLTVVEDGTIDQVTDLKLVGKNYAGYGEIQNENFVFLLENFAGANQPPKAISGQLWFDSGVNKLKFYDGTQWRTAGGAEVGTTEPTGLTSGDFWFDSTNEQLYAYNGTSFVLIGPQGVGSSITRFQSRTIRDTAGVARPVIVSIVDDAVVHIISRIAFTIGTADASSYVGFTTVRAGLTLRNSDTGITTSTDRWWGTATNAEKLGGVAAADYLLKSSPSFSNAAAFADAGFTVGGGNDLLVKIVNDNEGLISNTVGQVIYLQCKTAQGATSMPFKIKATELLPGHTNGITPTDTTYTPGTTNSGINIGSSSEKFNQVHATSFNGLATEASAIKVGSIAYTGSIASSANTVAIRDATNDITARMFHGISTKAQYADLAENYLADDNYEPGTVMVFGGQEEITVSTKALDAKVAGVVSTNPAYLMNDSIDGTPIALRGRVPCKVKGPVCKGDLLVTSAEKGVAEVPNGPAIPAYCVLGKALEDIQDDSIRLIEVVV